MAWEEGDDAEPAAAKSLTVLPTRFCASAKRFGMTTVLRQSRARDAKKIAFREMTLLWWLLGDEDGGGEPALRSVKIVRSSRK
jgi:hypothetical protein